MMGLKGFDRDKSKKMDSPVGDDRKSSKPSKRKRQRIFSSRLRQRQGRKDLVIEPTKTRFGGFFMINKIPHNKYCMKNWCYADIPDWGKYQPNLRKFILHSVANTEKIYNYVDLDLFKSNCIDIVELFKNHYGSDLERVIVFKMTKESISQLGDKFIHIDSGLRTARLNWPILNPQCVVTKYFKITDPDYQPARHFINPPFKDYIDICDAACCEEVDNVCVDRPIIFTVNSTPHGMYTAGDQWPRIMCSFNFNDDTNLIKYLE